jgi:hypothetical protein
VTVWTAPAHTCLRGRRCPDYDDDHKSGKRIEARDGLCDSCQRRLSATLTDLPATYTRLEQMIADRKAGGEKVSGTRENPLPPRVDVLTMQTDIDALVSTWSPLVARRLRVQWTERDMWQTRIGFRVSRGARLLAGAVEALLGLPVAEVPVWTPVGFDDMSVKRSGLEAAADFLALGDRSRRLLSGGDGHARLPVPCPSCEAPALVRRNGADQVDCGSCGRRWPESDYRRLCLILADDYQPNRSRRRLAA